MSDIYPNCMFCELPLVEGEPCIPIWAWGPDSKVIGGVHADFMRCSYRKAREEFLR